MIPKRIIKFNAPPQSNFVGSLIVAGGLAVLSLWICLGAQRRSVAPTEAIQDYLIENFGTQSFVIVPISVFIPAFIFTFLSLNRKTPKYMFFGSSFVEFGFRTKKPLKLAFTDLAEVKYNSEQFLIFKPKDGSEIQFEIEGYRARMAVKTLTENSVDVREFCSKDD